MVDEKVEASKTRENEYEMNIIYNRELIKKLSKDVAKGKIIGREELVSLIGTLTGFENILFTEYKRAFHLEYRSFREYEPIKKNDTDLNILTLIIDDEERHQRILSAIIKLSQKKLSFSPDAPIVKYQNPDSWYVPPRRSRN
jgi:hypothetical protein